MVTLDTTTLGWRPQDLNLGSLPFAQGQGIGQYSSDPRFRDLVRERIAAARASGVKQDVEANLGALRSLLSTTRSHPAAAGGTSAPRSRTRRSRPSSTSTPARD